MSGLDENSAAGDAAAVRLASAPCPLCRAAIEVVESHEPQAVVCSSCGLSCTVSAPPPPPAPIVEEPVAENPLAWLEQSPRSARAQRAEASLALASSAPHNEALSGWTTAVAAALAGVLVVGGFAWFGGRNAIPPATASRPAGADAHDELESLAAHAAKETEARAAAEREVRLVSAKYMAMQASELLPSEPWRSLHLAVEAVEATTRHGEPAVVEAHQSLRDALRQCRPAREFDGCLLCGHEGAVRALAVSPDNRWLATGGADRTVRLWDVTGASPGAFSIILGQHQAEVSVLAFSCDGRWLASGGLDSCVCLWSPGSPRSEPIVLPGLAAGVREVVTSPNGRWLAAVYAGTGEQPDSARLWDLQEGVKKPKSLDLRGHGGRIQAVAISPDNRWLAMCVDETTRLWDLNQRAPGSTSLSLQSGHGAATHALFTADNRWLIACGQATAGDRGGVCAWDLSSADLSTPLALGEDQATVRALAASVDSRRLAAAGTDGRVRLWSLAAGEQPAVQGILAGGTTVSAAAMSGNGDWLAVADATGTIRLWDLSTSTESPVTVNGNEGAVSAICFTPDGRWLTAAGADGIVRLWNLDLANLTTQAKALARGRLRPQLGQSPWTIVSTVAAGRQYWLDAARRQASAMSGPWTLLAERTRVLHAAGPEQLAGSRGAIGAAPRPSKQLVDVEMPSTAPDEAAAEPSALAANAGPTEIDSVVAAAPHGTQSASAPWVRNPATRSILLRNAPAQPDSSAVSQATTPTTPTTPDPAEDVADALREGVRVATPPRANPLRTMIR